MKAIDFEGKRNISGERVRARRLSMRLSQAALAAKVQTEGVILEQDAISRIELGDRMVAENDSFWAFVPYAARFAFEIWVLPKRHVPTFPALTTQERWDLAKITKELLLRVKALRPGMDYNLCLEDSPVGPERKLFHWHLEILPRMGALAGFEYATASFLNPVLPETAAAVLREKA